MAFVRDRDKKKKRGMGLMKMGREGDKKKDPLWSKAICVVEGEIVKRTMLLPTGWHIYSEELTSLCQRCMVWGGFKNENGETLELPTQYVDERQLWDVYRVYVHDGVNSAKTAVKRRCETQWKGE